MEDIEAARLEREEEEEVVEEEVVVTETPLNGGHYAMGS